MATNKIALILFCIFFVFSCYKQNNLNTKTNLPNVLREVSGTEIIMGSELIWMINDKGNAPKLFGVDKNGKIKKELLIEAKNVDWEDLTSDKQGNIYIGDFGNNLKNRMIFTIYKVSRPNKAINKSTAEQINFSLPKGVKSKDFEAFFMYNNVFYIFSKEKEKSIMIKVPNTIGNHVAELITEFILEGKQNRITSSDISDDGKTILLLNHSKVWMLNNYDNDDFFKGTLTPIKFNHNTQKEGVCFKNKETLLITDEKSNGIGGNLYEFKLNSLTILN